MIEEISWAMQWVTLARLVKKHRSIMEMFEYCFSLLPSCLDWLLHVMFSVTVTEGGLHSQVMPLQLHQRVDLVAILSVPTHFGQIPLILPDFQENPCRFSSNVAKRLPLQTESL